MRVGRFIGKHFFPVNFQVSISMALKPYWMSSNNNFIRFKCKSQKFSISDSRSASSLNCRVNRMFSQILDRNGKCSLPIHQWCKTRRTKYTVAVYVSFTSLAVGYAHLNAIFVHWNMSFYLSFNWLDDTLLMGLRWKHYVEDVSNHHHVQLYNRFIILSDWLIESLNLCWMFSDLHWSFCWREWRRNL